jgi:hypothetical protein
MTISRHEIADPEQSGGIVVVVVVVVVVVLVGVVSVGVDGVVPVDAEVSVGAADPPSLVPWQPMRATAAPS